MLQEAQPFTRRQLIQGVKNKALYAVEGSVLLLAGACASTPQRPIPTKPVSQFDQDMRIISDEARRIGYASNPAEQQLWQRAYQRSAQRVPINPQTLDVAQNYFLQTLLNMSNSKNMYLSDAEKYLRTQRNIPVSVIVSSAIVANNKKVFAAVSGVNNNGEFVLQFDLDGNQILNDSNGLLLAIGTVHEIQHIKEDIEFNATLPPALTTTERVERLKQMRLSDPIGGELKAYGIQAEATIEALRLGVNTPFPEDFIHIPAVYIQAGKNTASPDWRQFISARLKP